MVKNENTCLSALFLSKLTRTGPRCGPNWSRSDGPSSSPVWSRQNVQGLFSSDFSKPEYASYENRKLVHALRTFVYVCTWLVKAVLFLSVVSFHFNVETLINLRPVASQHISDSTEEQIISEKFRRRLRNENYASFFLLLFFLSFFSVLLSCVFLFCKPEI